MKIAKRFLTAISFMFFVAFSQGQCQAEELSVAVVEFDVKGEFEVRDAGAMIAEMLITSLGNHNTFSLKERVLLKKIVQEQALGSSGVINPKSAVEIGKIYGVQAIVTGSVMKWGRIIQVNARLLDAANGTVIRTASIEAINLEEIPKKIELLAAHLIDKSEKNNDEQKAEPIIPKKVTEKLISDAPIKPQEINPYPSVPLMEGTWRIRPIKDGYSFLNYSKITVRHKDGKNFGVLELNAGANITIDEVTKENGIIKIGLLWNEIKAYEAGLIMNGLENIGPSDASTAFRIAKGMAKSYIVITQQTGDEMVGELHMWYIDAQFHLWKHYLQSGTIYDAGTEYAAKKLPPKPIRLIRSSE